MSDPILNQLAKTEENKKPECEHEVCFCLMMSFSFYMKPRLSYLMVQLKSAFMVSVMDSLFHPECHMMAAN